MAAGATVGESQLQRIIRDLHEAVAELAKEYRESGEPITDDSANLHKFSYKLEYLLQFDQKEKATFLGTKKDYWDYFIDCLAKTKGANDGIRFVKSITELKTSLGKGRAFIRYSLVHQRLADTLQQCVMNQRVTSDWYYSRSPFLKPHLNVDIINHLYELNDVQFDVASRGHDLDASWPTFARKTLGIGNSPGHMWKPPSRSSSINSLASNYSQPAFDLPCSPDQGHSLLCDLNESLPVCSENASTLEDLQLELDQSELKHRELLDKMQQLGVEAAELRGVVVELQQQLEVSLAAQEEQQGALKALRGKEEAQSRELEQLRAGDKAKDAEQRLLQEKLAAAEEKNIELLAKLDGFLNEKSQQTASHFDSAQKIHELLDRLKEAERAKIVAVAEAEERKMLAERLEEMLRVKETDAKVVETKVAAMSKLASEQRTKLEAKVEEQCRSIDTLQGTLKLREKEDMNQQKQLSDLQRLLEGKEKQMDENRKRGEKDRGEIQKKMGAMKKSLESELLGLRNQLKSKEAELTSNSGVIQELQTKTGSLTTERDALSQSLVQLEDNLREQVRKVEEYKTQCSNLMELNEKLLTTVKKSEEMAKDMSEHRSAMEAELAALRASEKQLRGQLDDTKMTVDEKEKRMREENRSLDESLQRASMAAKLSEATAKKLEQENHSLKEEQDQVKASLSSMQAALRGVQKQIEELEKSLGAARKNEANLEEQLRSKEAQLQEKESNLVELQQRLSALEDRERELEVAKASAEATCSKQTEMIQSLTSEKQAVERSQLERSAVHAKESQEGAAKLMIVEGQLEVNVKEVSRLQAEVQDLRVHLQGAKEEQLKSQAQAEVTEAQRDELRTLTEQLKSEIETLNQRHVAELVQSKKKEEALSEERDREIAARAQMALSEAALREEVANLKSENARLVLESRETQESLSRATTEMAELGMTVCKLGAEKEEAQVHRATDTARMETLQQEVERREANEEKLQQEIRGMREELARLQRQTEVAQELQQKLDKANIKVQSIRDSSKEETEALKFQMSSENMNLQTQVKNLSEELVRVKAQLGEELKKSSVMVAKVSELEAANEQFLQLTGEKDARITESEAAMRDSEMEIQQLKDSVNSAENTLAATEKICEDLKQRLAIAETDQEKSYLKFSAEIDDLSTTKTNLEERLIELIKDKDALWQKSDALEYEQKLRAAEQWWLVDKEATHCLDCKGQFTWWLRKHHCRLCGRIFCYYCCNNYVMTKLSGKKERCCKECYTQHSAVVERFTQAELSASDTQAAPPGPGPLSPSEPPPYKPTPRVTVSDPSTKSEDGAFDIITEEEVNGVYDSDTTSQTTAGSLEGEQEQRGAGYGTPDDPNEHVVTVQDAEINLLKSGDVTTAARFGVDDLSQFGDGSRELSIRPSGYSLITIAVDDAGPTISWMFSSEPKSVAFSVVYQESSHPQVEQSKVLIPLTRCNSHKETIQGQLKVRHPGLYTLIFDNSYSRFVSKKVSYQLTMEKPVIYDGSDFP